MKKYNTKDMLIILAVSTTLAVALLLTIVSIILDDFNKDIVYMSYEVKKGDNLTTIANRYYKDIYILKAIAEIKQINNMTNSNIYEGQIIRIKN